MLGVGVVVASSNTLEKYSNTGQVHLMASNPCLTMTRALLSIAPSFTFYVSIVHITNNVTSTNIEYPMFLKLNWKTSITLTEAVLWLAGNTTL